MPWIAGIGVAVAGAFGATIATTGLAAMVIGGAVVGAAVGGLYSAITGGDILQGVLFGAVGGAVVGFGGHAIGYSGYGVVGSESLASPISGATSFGASEGAAMAAQTAATEVSTTGGILGGITKEATKTGFGALFTTEGMAATGMVASLGSAFLQGGAGSDIAESKIASDEKMQSERLAHDKELAAANNETQLAAAEIARAAGDARNKSAEKMAAADLDFNKNKFSQEFSEDQWRDRKDREEKATAKQEFQTGLEQASQYVAGNTQVVGLVETSRRRKSLPSPAWYAQSAKPAATAQVPVQQPAQPQPAAVA